MEYMLLSDGSVLPYEPIPCSVRVVEELRNKGGVAYFWRHDSKPDIWMRIYAGDGALSAQGSTIIPDAIKLASMLE